MSDSNADVIGAAPVAEAAPPQRRSLLRSVVIWIVAVVAGLWVFFALMIVAVKWIDPPTTAVHADRRLQAWVHGKA